MTEADWLTCTDPQQMLEFLHGKASDRKLRLFAVACCRRVWSRIDELALRQVIEITERFVDGAATAAELGKSRKQAVHTHTLYLHIDELAQRKASVASMYSVIYSVANFHAFEAGWGIRHDLWEDERKAQSGILREIFGPQPLKAVALAGTYLTTTVTALATTIYTERSFEHLPILADCLEEGGCTNAELLQHLRSEGPHARGCWALDLLLAKA
jgi:hypothetical protein